jgi:hypothetical protein
MLILKYQNILIWLKNDKDMTLGCFKTLKPALKWPPKFLMVLYRNKEPHSFYFIFPTKIDLWPAILNL